MDHLAQLRLLGRRSVEPWRRVGSLALLVLGMAAPAGAETIISRVVAGAYHGCVLTSGGAVKCWGSNDSGQLGDGTRGTDRLTPVDVVGLASGIVAISAGESHTCALTSGGAVKCWGSNGSGTDRLTPVEVLGLDSSVTAIAAGGFHTCALTGAGAVKCWGYNGTGQLGDGTRTDRLAAIDVAGLESGVAAIATGQYHTCAVTTRGAMKCWGLNRYGELGDGTLTDRVTAVDVAGLESGVTAIAAGDAHTCALTTGGAAKCWGRSYQSEVPVDMPGLGSEVSAIALGGRGIARFVWYHACALTDGGAVKCWGDNSFGQLGDGTVAGSRTLQEVTRLDRKVNAIALGARHSCALTDDGRVRCWGDNSNGQLGDGTSGKDRLTPVDVIDLGNGVTAIATNHSHTCALTGAGAAKCWGGNYHGQLGNGTRGTDRLTPVDVVGLVSGVVAISAGVSHTCALTSSGAMKCWGDNSTHQLGDGTFTDRTAPADVVALDSGVAAIATGQDHTCAVTTRGAVKCWGYNGAGQLGDGTRESYRSTPGDVVGLQSNVAAIAAGGAHTCALTRGGAVKCWGSNGSGQLGDGTHETDRLTPVDVVGLASGVVAISSGGTHTCALTIDGAVKCWGNNNYGQLGDGTREEDRQVPVDVFGLGSGVTAIATSTSHTCALADGEAVKCWGLNGSGQLGDGTRGTIRLTPVDVVGLGSRATAIAAGGAHTCALTGAGAVKCWGGNYEGQLGDEYIRTVVGLDVSGQTIGTAVEYYHQSFDHYFVTADDGEISLLDGGAYGGVWSRTGHTFAVWTEPGTGLSATCRFFSESFAPRSSHFYTPIQSECELRKNDPLWLFEGVAFYLQTSATGECPPGTIPLHRLYNASQGGAPNHRFTTSREAFDQMRLRGWIAEGNGGDVVFACAPEG